MLSRIRELRTRGRLAAAAGKAVGMLARGEFEILMEKAFPDRLDEQSRYERWLRGRVATAEFCEMVRAQQQSWENPPRFCIVAVVRSTPDEVLANAVQSLIEQLYPWWEMHILHAGPLVRETLPEVFADSRVKLVPLDCRKGVANACNGILERTEAEFLSIVAACDRLAPHALFAAARVIIANPDVELLYTDEDSITESNQHVDPVFKPGWSPELLLSADYLGAMTLLRCSALCEHGGFQTEYDHALVYDAALRMGFPNGRVEHISDILYHRCSNSLAKTASSDQLESEYRHAVQSAIRRAGYKGLVGAGPYELTHRISLELKNKPLVSIVVPSAGQPVAPEGGNWLVLDLVRSIVRKTTYPNFEIVVCDNSNFGSELTEQLGEFGVRLIHYEAGRFNLAEKMNLSVKHARGDYVILLNDDTLVMTPEWIEEMLMWCQQDGIAGVGAKLLFSDGCIQHCGMHLNKFGPGHVLYRCLANDTRLCGSAHLVRNYSAVTGACLMVAKSDYWDVGGFDPAYQTDYSDVDFCLKLRDRHDRIVFTPFACLHHLESMSKEAAPPNDFDTFRENWENALDGDPYANRQLSLDGSRPTVALPPRSLIDEYFGGSELGRSDT